MKDLGRILKSAASGAVIAVVFALCLLSGTKEVLAQPIASITYNFSGYSIPAGSLPIYTVDSGVMGTLFMKNPDGTLLKDAAGNYLADVNAVSGFVSVLAAKYDVPGVSTINQALEVNYLITALNSGISDPSHSPSMTVTAPAVVPAPLPGAVDPALVQQNVPLTVPGIVNTDTVAASPGATYVDVNITTQKLVYFVNGTPFIISDIVSGRSGSRSTPTGTFAVYAKQTGRTLKGPGYSAFVNFWMPFYKSYGLHDANWRSSFGGNIYQSGGSHGCVNMPYETASALYNSVNIGTPVVIHY